MSKTVEYHSAGRGGGDIFTSWPEDFLQPLTLARYFSGVLSPPGGPAKGCGSWQVPKVELELTACCASGGSAGHCVPVWVWGVPTSSLRQRGWLASSPQLPDDRTLPSLSHWDGNPAASQQDSSLTLIWSSYFCKCEAVTRLKKHTCSLHLIRHLVEVMCVICQCPGLGCSCSAGGELSSPTCSGEV